MSNGLVVSSVVVEARVDTGLYRDKVSWKPLCVERWKAIERNVVEACEIASSCSVRANSKTVR